MTELSRQVRSKEVSPVELTELYLVLSQALTDIEKLGVRLEPIPVLCQNSAQPASTKKLRLSKSG